MGRFFAVLLPSAGVMLGIFAGIAAGAIPVSFATGGDIFKIKVQDFRGYGFQQYMGEVRQGNGTPEPVATTIFDHATMGELCQTATLKLPLVGGTIVLKILAGDAGTPASAKDLVIQAAGQRGDAYFQNMKIGIDASALTDEPQYAGSPGRVALESDQMRIAGLNQDTWQVTASTFTLPHLRLSAGPGEECY
jgi:hypothetical protein